MLLVIAPGLLWAGCLEAPARLPQGWTSSSMRIVAYGDSFTAATGIAPEWNWATGTAPGAESVLQRVHETSPDAVGFNAATAGARFDDLPTQLQRSPPGADLVLVLLGLNDVCLPGPGFDAQTFRSSVQTGLAQLTDRHPSAAVILFAIPDITEFRRLHQSVPQAAGFWAGVPYCQDALAPDASDASARRAQARVSAANMILRTEAEDAGAVFSPVTLLPRFNVDQVSKPDFFHPNEAGEKRLADLAWTAVAGIETVRLPVT